MRKVVLFKSQSQDYVQAFLDAKFKPLFVEPLQFEFVNARELSDQLVQTEYTGLILTSPRAIDAVAKCWHPDKYVTWMMRRVYTVGNVSRIKIRQDLGINALGSTSGSAQSLANIILKDNPGDCKFLFPCGNLSSEILPNMLKSAGRAIDPLTVYETRESDNLRMDLMELNYTASPCCLVFFSPSGCEYIHRQLQTFCNNLSELPHFAIGNSTAHKIETLGLEVAGVAAQPKAESVVEAVVNYFSNVPTSGQ